MSMRYMHLEADTDPDYIQVTENGQAGSISLCATEELIEIVNEIRSGLGYTDLIGADNEVYYDFYLCFDISAQSVSILAICNYGEADDKKNYELPMTEEEKHSVVWQLIRFLTNAI